MIVCLACGNCTDSSTCEVCGMILHSDDNHEMDSEIPDTPNILMSKEDLEEKLFFSPD